MAQNMLDAQLEAMMAKPDDELRQIVGSYALSEHPDDLTRALSVERSINLSAIQEAADNFLQQPVIREAVCGQGGLLDTLETVTAGDIVTVLLGALGLASGSAVPTAIIAAAVIIFRAGVRVYCRPDDAAAPAPPAAG